MNDDDSAPLTVPNERAAKQRRMADAFPFQGDDKCQYRDGWAIVVPNPKTGGVTVWGDMVFQDMDGANATAARCVSGPCDIVRAQEVQHRTRWKKSYRLEKSIIIKDDGQGARTTLDEGTDGEN